MAQLDNNVNDNFFPSWDELLAACEEWAISQGWRFSQSALFQVCSPESPNYAAQARALPMALDYGDRVKGIQCFADQPLLSEFRRCQGLVAQAAVHNSMVATCRALGLWQEGAPVDEDCAWQDCSQPIEVVARRLQNHAAQVEAAGLTEKLARRTRQASFVVEFGLEHGLPSLRDATSEATLRDFLERIKEWDGGHDNEMCAHSLTTPYIEWRVAQPTTRVAGLTAAVAVVLLLPPAHAWYAPGLRLQRARARHGEPLVYLGGCGAAVAARSRCRLVSTQPESGHHRGRHLWRRARSSCCWHRCRSFGRRKDGTRQTMIISRKVVRRLSVHTAVGCGGRNELFVCV